MVDAGEGEHWTPGVVPGGAADAHVPAGRRWAGVLGAAVLVGPDGWLPAGRSPEEAGVVVVAESEPLFLGALGDDELWAVDAQASDAAPHGDRELEAVDLMSLHGRAGEQRWAIAGRAVQLVEWTRTHRFCGRCATPTVAMPGERARRCPRCGLLAFPRLAPAMIVLVERENEVLLARGVSFPLPMYSCLAGFVEPGETVEQAVSREVREEVGVEVDEIRYQASQPWPFPHSLMLGFRARWVGGDIVIDPSENADAGWFLAEALPTVPPPISIARKLIDSWVAEAG